MDTHRSNNHSDNIADTSHQGQELQEDNPSSKELQELNQDGLLVDDRLLQRSEPPLVSPPTRPRPHLINSWMMALLGFLIVLIIAGGVFGPGLVKSMTFTRTTVSKATPTVIAQQTAVPTPTPQLTQHQQDKLLASQYVAGMSLDDELGQLIMAQYSGADYSTDLDTMVNQQHIGGVIMYEYNGNIVSIDQTKGVTAQMQQHARTPLLISVDQEGWNVTRWEDIYGRDKNVDLSADAMHQSGNPDVAKNEGQRVGQLLLNLGINVNFAPDIDVGVYNGYIDWDYRSFGQTPDDVIKYASAYAQGLQSTGITAGFKHFPGLGDVLHGFDPHSTLPVVSADKEHINDVDLATFQHFIQTTNQQEQADLIMPTDVLMPAIDPTYPAEFSHTFITDILRNQLGFDGVSITDSLQMGGVRVNDQALSVADASVLAIQAGNDMVLDMIGSDQVAEVISAFKVALQNGTLTKARVDEAATRVVTLKLDRHLMTISSVTPTVAVPIPRKPTS